MKVKIVFSYVASQQHYIKMVYRVIDTTEAHINDREILDQINLYFEKMNSLPSKCIDFYYVPDIFQPELLSESPHDQ